MILKRFDASQSWAGSNVSFYHKRMQAAELHMTQVRTTYAGKNILTACLYFPINSSTLLIKASWCFIKTHHHLWPSV